MQNLIELLPGEHLAGFIGRFHFLGLGGSYDGSLKYLGLKKRTIAAQRFFHSDDLQLCRLFEGKGFSNVWFDHGFGQYVWPFLKCSEKEQILSGQFFQCGLKNIIGETSVKHRYWRWCGECVQEDDEELGVSYYHRDHQLPGVFHCQKHGHGLSGHCQTCGFQVDYIRILFIPPKDDICPVCREKMPGYDGYFDEEMALIERATLHLAKTRAALSIEDLANVVRRHLGLQKDEFFTLRGKMRLKDWHASFQNSLNSKAMDAYFSNCRELDGRLTLPLLRKPRLYDAETKHGPLHPLAHLLTLQFVGHDLNFNYQNAA